MGMRPAHQRGGTINHSRPAALGSPAGRLPARWQRPAGPRPERNKPVTRLGPVQAGEVRPQARGQAAANGPARPFGFHHGGRAATLTLALPKVGLLDAPNVGELYLADISVPPLVYQRMGMSVPELFRQSSLLRID